MPCFTAAELVGGRPSLEQVQATLPWFLASLPSEACAKGGAGAYSDAIQVGGGGWLGVEGSLRMELGEVGALGMLGML